MIQKLMVVLSPTSPSLARNHQSSIVLKVLKIMEKLREKQKTWV